MLVKALLPDSLPANVEARAADHQRRGDRGRPRHRQRLGRTRRSHPPSVCYGWNTVEVLAFKTGNPDAPVGAIPGHAFALCQIRFVVGSDSGASLAHIRTHLRRHGFDDSRRAARQASPWPPPACDPDDAWVRWGLDSIRRSTGKRPSLLPNFGGSLPNDVFAEAAGHADAVVSALLPGLQPARPNEHLLGSVAREGLQIMAGVFWDLAEGGQRRRPASRRPAIADVRMPRLLAHHHQHLRIRASQREVDVADAAVEISRLLAAPPRRFRRFRIRCAPGPTARSRTPGPRGARNPGTGCGRAPGCGRAAASCACRGNRRPARGSRNCPSCRPAHRRLRTRPPPAAPRRPAAPRPRIQQLAHVQRQCPGHGGQLFIADRDLAQLHLGQVDSATPERPDRSLERQPAAPCGAARRLRPVAPGPLRGGGGRRAGRGGYGVFPLFGANQAQIRRNPGKSAGQA